MKCPKCGNEIPDGSKFCPECDQPINNEPAEEVKQPSNEYVDDPAHETVYLGAFSQKISGSNQINMKGGVTPVQPLDPKRAYKGMVASLSVAIVFATLGLVFGLLAKDPTRKEDTLFFILPLVGAFTGLFLGLIEYLVVQPRLFKEQKPTSFIDWIPTILFVVDLGVTIPALIFAIQAFGVLLA